MDTGEDPFEDYGLLKYCLFCFEDYLSISSKALEIRRNLSANENSMRNAIKGIESLKGKTWVDDTVVQYVGEICEQISMLQNQYRPAMRFYLAGLNKGAYPAKQSNEKNGSSGENSAKIQRDNFMEKGIGPPHTFNFKPAVLVELFATGGDGDENVIPFMFGDGAEDANYIMSPYTVDHVHWVLNIYSVTHRNWVILDPLGAWELTFENFGNVILKLDSISSQIASLDNHHLELSIKNVTEGKKMQSDGYSCGRYICAYIIMFTMGIPHINENEYMWIGSDYIMGHRQPESVSNAIRDTLMKMMKFLTSTQ